MSTGIHPTAAVDPSAKIGDNVIAAPFTIVESSVETGDGKRIGSNARIGYGYGARSGNDCRIFHGAFIGEAPQSLKFRGIVS